jgi:hypothetical protein
MNSLCLVTGLSGLKVRAWRRRDNSRDRSIHDSRELTGVVLAPPGPSPRNRTIRRPPDPPSRESFHHRLRAQGRQRAGPRALMVIHGPANGRPTMIHMIWSLANRPWQDTGAGRPRLSQAICFTRPSPKVCGLSFLTELRISWVTRVKSTWLMLDRGR